jgi:hypothetical protein
MTNISGTTLKMPKSSLWGETRISINGSEPLVIIGDGPIPRADDYSVLEPGEVREWTEDLSPYVRSVKPDPSGEWRVERTETFPRLPNADVWSGTLRSPAVQFNVRK